MFKKYWKVIAIVWFTVVVLVLPIESICIKKLRPESIPYTQFLEDLDNDRIERIAIDEYNNLMKITYYTDETRNMSYEERYNFKDVKRENQRMVQYPDNETFREDMLKDDIILTVGSFGLKFTPSIWLITAYSLGIIFLIALLDRMVPVTNSKDTFDEIRVVDTRFSDVIGHDEIIKELQFLTGFLNQRGKSASINADIPKGLLLFGPPGTGKTLMARAIAGECNMPFIYLNASSCIEMYVGLGAKRIREVFKQARKIAPSVVFIDEIDAIGMSRESNSGMAEHRQTLNALLQELDGFTKDTSVFVIAATNTADSLDKALTRAGRFDRHITVNPPENWKMRLDLFNYYYKDKPCSSDINFENYAKTTAGFTGADISMIANESALIALSKGNDYITTEDVEDAIDSTMFKGNKRLHDKAKKDFDIICYHEAGHAVVHYLLGQPISRISVQGSTSGVGGFVLSEDSDNVLCSKADLKIQVMQAYGGRIAEELILGEDNITTGASSDIDKATKLINDYVNEYGFNKSLVCWKSISNKNDGMIPNAELISSISKEWEDETRQLLKNNLDLVYGLAEKLRAVETLSGEDAVSLLNCVIQNREDR